jgi:hypothetical protein
MRITTTVLESGLASSLPSITYQNPAVSFPVFPDDFSAGKEIGQSLKIK